MILGRAPSAPAAPMQNEEDLMVFVRPAQRRTKSNGMEMSRKLERFFRWKPQNRPTTMESGSPCLEFKTASCTSQTLLLANDSAPFLVETTMQTGAGAEYPNGNHHQKFAVGAGTTDSAGDALCSVGRYTFIPCRFRTYRVRLRVNTGAAHGRISPIPFVVCPNHSSDYCRRKYRTEEPGP